MLTLTVQMLNAGDYPVSWGSSWVQAQRDRQKACRESLAESEVEENWGCWCLGSSMFSLLAETRISHEVHLI
jgi:hypothetical protein